MIPPVVELRELGSDRFAPAVAWVTPSLAARFDVVPQVPIGELPDGTRTLVAVGGGSVIDRAKAAARGHVQVVAVPTIWGAGAEASPVVVLDAPDGTKDIEVDDAFVPAGRVVWAEVAAEAPPELRRWGAADVWGHALEALPSPLADDAVRVELAAVVHELLELDPETGDAASWLELSARSCAGQARAGVGLAHGIAHTMEGVVGLGHARIMAAVLPPVFRLTVSESARWAEVAAEHDLDANKILARIDALATPGDLDTVLAALGDEWRRVLRDPCTRTNAFLVKRGHLEVLRG